MTETLSERVLVRLSRSDRSELKKKAAASARSVSGYIRYLILCDLDRANGHPAAAPDPNGQPGDGDGGGDMEN
jgi:hypothetical protein